MSLPVLFLHCRGQTLNSFLWTVLHSVLTAAGCVQWLGCVYCYCYGSLWQSFIVVTAVCDNRVLFLLLRHSLTIVYCYGSLWQSCIVVVPSVCGNRVLLLRQSVTVVYCCSAVCDNLVLLRKSVTVVYCCSSSLWQSCIVVTAVC